MRGVPILPIGEARERMCKTAGHGDPACEPEFLARLLESPGLGDEGQSRTAVLYVMVVACFYLVIVLLLVGTNLTRPRQDRQARELEEQMVEVSLTGQSTSSRLTKDRTFEEELHLDTV